MHSIRWKMMMVMISAIMTCILALGLIWFYSLGAESDRNAVETMSLLSENTQWELDSFLDSIELSEKMAVRLARDSLADPDIRRLGSSGTEEEIARLDAALQAHCDEMEHNLSSIVHSVNDVISYCYCINDDYGSNVHGFFWSRAGADDFVKQADIVSAELDRNDTDHNMWYFTSLREAAAVWVGPYKSKYLDENWVITYVTPIYHQGFVVGVLGMDVLFDTLVTLADSVRVYDSGFAFLMDRDGNVLYHPDVAITTEKVSFDQGLSRDLLRRRSTGDMMVRYERNGETWQLAFAALSNNFKVGVTAPVSEITAYRRKMTTLIALVALVILLAFSLITLWIVTRLTRPLTELTDASKKLMAGEYNVELDYHGKDEIGILTKAFRQMRDHVKLYISDLNHQAHTDAMTGVRNKGAFDIASASLDREIASKEGPTPEFAVIMMDCNLLKHINDEYGHAYGDVYLKMACGLICEVFAHSPVYRVGGDEFVVLLRQRDYEDRDRLMREFDRLAQERNQAARHPWERINLAHGISTFRPGRDKDVEQVLRRADERMYQQKKQSRG